MEVTSRTVPVTRKRQKANGEWYIVHSTHTYYLKGYKRKDGTRVNNVVYTDEQKAEIRQKVADGVKKNRIMKDYMITQLNLKKILDGEL